MTRQGKSEDLYDAEIRSWDWTGYAMKPSSRRRGRQFYPVCY
jgi:hypothetical protein